MSRRALVVALLGGAALLSAGVAEAFIPMGARWAGATADVTLSTGSFPDGSAQRRAAEDAFEAWNRVSGSEFLFNYRASSQSGAFSRGDGQSGVAFSNQVQGSVLGVTFSQDFGRTRSSADVLFNAGVRWSFDGSPSRFEYDFGSTARHEFGHALGLDHSDLGCRALMGGGCGAPGVVRQLTSDDVAGIRFLYPGTSRSGGGGGGSSAGQVDWRLARVTVQPARARAGDTVTVSYVVENAGTASAATAPARVYVLSTNDTITTQDQAITSDPERRGPFAPGASFQGSTQLQVSSGVTPGAYWIGVLVDARGAVSEADEGNNAAGARLDVLAAGSTGGSTGSTGGSTGAPPPAAQVDWEVAGVILQPDRVRDGDTVTLTFAIRNVGGAAAGALPELGIFVSDNDTITTRDAEVHRIPERAAQVPPGSERQEQLSFVVSLPEGDHFIGVLADPDDARREASEDNNAGAAALTVLGAASSGGATPGSGASTPPAGATGGATSPAAGASGAATPAATASSPTSTASADRSSGGGGCSLAPGAPSDSPAPGAALALLLLLGVALRRRAEGG